MPDVRVMAIPLGGSWSMGFRMGPRERHLERGGSVFSHAEEFRIHPVAYGDFEEF